MYRTYGYPVNVEWRNAFIEERRRRIRASAGRPSSHITTAQVYWAPQKRTSF